MTQVKSGELFIHTTNTDLHHSQEVEAVVGYLRQGGEKIPNNPEAKLHAYIGFLASKEYVNDGIITGDRESIARQVSHLVIAPGDVPESYFDLQRRIAREQGHGDISITADMRRQMTQALQADQRKSLETWAEYINGPDGTYPVWFEYYAWESLQKLGQFNKEKGEFTKRTKSTVAPYPELNREALAYVYDKLAKSLKGDIADEPEKLQKLLAAGNFGKLYAHALLEATSAKEIIKTTEGSWKKYDQTDDTRTARRLSESLAGYGTGWCTAGEETAATQLQGGDFYVYYTRDADGKDTTPRVAIRMYNGEVSEVRGILEDQNLEPDFYDIVQEKLASLPGGAEYQQKAEDMKRLTKLDNLLRDDPNAELSIDDLRFLYEFDRPIRGFGYRADPRIKELIMSRPEKYVDLFKVYDVDDDETFFDKVSDAHLLVLLNSFINTQGMPKVFDKLFEAGFLDTQMIRADIFDDLVKRRDMLELFQLFDKYGCRRHILHYYGARLEEVPPEILKNSNFLHNALRHGVRFTSFEFVYDDATPGHETGYSTWLKNPLCIAGLDNVLFDLINSNPDRIQKKWQLEAVLQAYKSSGGIVPERLYSLVNLEDDRQLPLILSYADVLPISIAELNGVIERLISQPRLDSSFLADAIKHSKILKRADAHRLRYLKRKLFNGIRGQKKEYYAWLVDDES